jgi:hypothetical protein
MNGAGRLLEECKRVARQNESNEPSFWNRATEADAELLHCLIKGELEEKFAVVAAHYRRAIGTGSTQREVLTIVQHLAFLEEMLTGARRGVGPDDKQVRALARLRSQLSPAP